MLAVVCAEALVAIETLFLGGWGTFAERASSSFSVLTFPVYPALAVGAVVLVTRFGPPVPRARLVNLVAAGVLAAAAFFGLVTFVVGLFSGTTLVHTIENVLTGLPTLGLTALALAYAVSVLPPAPPSAVRPRQEGGFGMLPGEGRPMTGGPGYAPQQGYAEPPALPPASYVPPQPYVPADQRPETYVQQPAGADMYAQQAAPVTTPHTRQNAVADPYAQRPGAEPYGQQAGPAADPYGQAPGPGADPYGQAPGQQGFGRPGEPQPYAPAGEAPGDGYAPQHSQPLDAYASALRSEPYGNQTGQQLAQGQQGQQGTQGQQGQQVSLGQQVSPGQQAPQGQPGRQPSSPFAPAGAAPGAFVAADAFTTGARQAVPAPDPLTAPTAFDQSPSYGRPGGAYGQTGPQPSPLDQPSSSSYGQPGPLDQPSATYGQTGPQQSPLDLPSSSSYGQTGPQPSPLDLPSATYGQTGPQQSPLDQPSSYGQTAPQSSPLDQPAYGGYPPAEPSPLYAEAADARQQQIAHAYQQAQSYQQAQGTGSEQPGGGTGPKEYTGTQPVRTPDYVPAYSGGPFGHPQSPQDSAGYPRATGEAPAYRPAQDQPYPQDAAYPQPRDPSYPQDAAYPPAKDHKDQPYPQDQPYSQAKDQPYPQDAAYPPVQESYKAPSWEEPATEKTVRFDPKAYQNDPLNAPMPPQPGRRDEAIDPTAIYAPDRASQARPEESPGRDQAGSGVDQGERWYGSDR
ncbi:hypothetical protein [Sphaerisporangium corydalis]|uniref:Uncharacterized protein n=1 Tax=Sphaerisporangium corydalis TaxID=1441875 RepID=A0ABV9ED15_9ACTN|nr:hypothetical protein [Sphaerisporangium corydalis]